MFFFAGCSSSSQTVVDGQMIMWDNYTMTIDQRFVTTNIESLIKPNLRQSIIQAYSIPSPSSEFFEKNIIISREGGSFIDLAQYVNDVTNAIQETRGGYNRSLLSDTSFRCGSGEIPSFLHEFSLNRGNIAGTGGQTLFFVQYIFALDKSFYIISSSTDDENDVIAFEGYIDTLACVDSIRNDTSSEK